MQHTTDSRRVPVHIARRALVSAALAVLLALGGCSWGPPQFGRSLRWSPGGEQVLIDTREGLFIADQDGNAGYLVLWETLAQEWASQVKWVRYSPELKHYGWTNEKVSIAHVRHCDAPYRLVLLDPNEPLDFRGRMLAIPTTGAPESFQLSIWASISAVTADGLVIGAGRGMGPLDRTLPREVAFPDDKEHNVIFAYDLRDDSFEAVGGRDYRQTRAITFDHPASCWWWLLLEQDSVALMRLDVSRNPLRLHESVQCAVIPMTRQDVADADISIAGDGIVRVRRLQAEWTDDGFVMRVVQYAFDPSSGTLHQSNIAIPKSQRRVKFAVNPSGTMAAFFRDRAPGELTFVSLVDGSVRTVRYEKTTWLRETFSGSPLDGRAMVPTWIDDHRVCTLWPSDAIRDRLEIVVWDTSGEAVVRNVISDRWPEDLRPSMLRIRLGFWDTL